MKMKRLVQLVLACLLFWSLSAFGDTHFKDGDAWRIVEDEQDASTLFLENVKDSKLRHEVNNWAGPGYRYLGHLPVEKDDMVLLVYFGGSAGTSEIVHVYGAIVFNTRPGPENSMAISHSGRNFQPMATSPTPFSPLARTVSRSLIATRV